MLDLLNTDDLEARVCVRVDELRALDDEGLDSDGGGREEGEEGGEDGEGELEVSKIYLKQTACTYSSHDAGQAVE